MVLHLVCQDLDPSWTQVGPKFFDCTPTVRQILWAHLQLLGFSSCLPRRPGILGRGRRRPLPNKCCRASSSSLYYTNPIIQYDLTYSCDYLDITNLNLTGNKCLCRSPSSSRHQLWVTG